MAIPTPTPTITHSHKTNMKLQMPVYRARLLRCRQHPDIKFDDALILPTDGWSATIYAAQLKVPIKGAIRQRDYASPRVVLDSIIYTISLCGYGEEEVETDVEGEKFTRGYTDNYDEVFEHQFQGGVTFEDSMIVSSRNQLYDQFDLSTVFPRIKTTQQVKILQFIA